MAHLSCYLNELLHIFLLHNYYIINVAEIQTIGHTASFPMLQTLNVKGAPGPLKTSEDRCCAVPCRASAPPSDSTSMTDRMLWRHVRARYCTRCILQGNTASACMCERHQINGLPFSHLADTFLQSDFSIPHCPKPHCCLGWEPNTPTRLPF